VSALQPAPAKPGTLVCVVGPSGAGKDTLIDAAHRHFSADPRFAFPQRLITRTGQIGESHRPLARPNDEKSHPEGAFLLSWAAHGEVYAIPIEVLGQLEAGHVVVANVSRSVIAEAHAAWPKLAVFHVTAPPDVLQGRLLARGREDADVIAHRLARAPALAIPAGIALEEIDNGGSLADAEACFIASLKRLAD